MKVGRILFGPDIPQNKDIKTLDATRSRRVSNIQVNIPKVQLEVCICAAMLMDDGYIIRGHRHVACLMTAGNMGYGRQVLRSEQQGFVTSRNRFVDRMEGARLQNAAGLVSADTKQSIKDMLFSEDLY